MSSDLADTQRVIIEAAELRGYRRGVADADARLVALEAGMRDAEARMRAWGDEEVGQAYSGPYYACADELAALLDGAP